jgi:hypothetical protein
MAGMHQTKQLTTVQVYKDFEKNLIRESQHTHGFEVKGTTTTLEITPKELKRTLAVQNNIIEQSEIIEIIVLIVDLFVFVLGQILKVYPLNLHLKFQC